MKTIYLTKIISLFVMGLLVSYSFGQTTFNYTGGMQTYVVPAGINSIQIEAWGAQGQGGNGGLGGYVSGGLSVSPGQTLNVFVGGQNGYNGGGIGWSSTTKNGGGASDVRDGGVAITDRVIVAGGGGSGGQTDTGPHIGGDGGGGTVGANYAGGAGGTGYGGAGGIGGLTGGTGNTSCHSGGAGGGGFTSGGIASCNTCYTSTCGTDGVLGLGGNGDTWESGQCYNDFNGTAGGGGGYYGGGGTSVGNCGSGGGGGGSSWTGSLTNNILTGGLQNGDGQIVITILCAALDTTASSSEVCDGEVVTLSALSTGTGVISWDNGITDNVAFTPSLGTTTYTATSTDANDCSFSIDIISHPNPTVDGGIDVILCNGIEDTLLAATGTADSFTWDNGITDNTVFTPVIGLTTYTVTATNVAGSCTSSDAVQLAVGSPAITLMSSDEIAGNDGSITLTVNSGNGTLTFDWDNDGTGDNDDTSNQTSLAGGTYTVTVIDAFGCTTTESIIVGSQLGLEEIGNNIVVYPNPTNGEVSIQLSGNFEYTLVNTLGQVIYKGKAVDSEKIDLSKLENGSYFLRITQEERSSVRQLIKE
jgi:hypothetical protein